MFRVGGVGFGWVLGWVMKFGGCSCLGTGSVGLGDTTILGGGGAYWFGCGRSRWRLVVGGGAGW